MKTPRVVSLTGTHALNCLYGENAWQAEAALYSTGSDDPLALPCFTPVEGAAPSYNNLADVDRLVQALTHIVAAYAKNGFSTAQACVALVVKHGNLCGAAVTDSDPIFALKQMITGDLIAVHGGVVMVNFVIDEELANLLIHYGMDCEQRRLLDTICAPSFTPEAVEILRRKKGKCRLMINTALAEVRTASALNTTPRVRPVRGGFLLQDNYTYVLDLVNQRSPVPVVVHGPSLSPEQLFDMLLAWAICATSNSNTVTLVRDGALLANAVGQQDRVGAATLALWRARRGREQDRTWNLLNTVAASDSFFPFRDGPAVLVEAGVKTILATSGSVNDQQVIDYCTSNGATLVMVSDKLARGFFGH